MGLSCSFLTSVVQEENEGAGVVREPSKPVAGNSNMGSDGTGRDELYKARAVQHLLPSLPNFALQ